MVSGSKLLEGSWHRNWGYHSHWGPLFSFLASMAGFKGSFFSKDFTRVLHINLTLTFAQNLFIKVKYWTKVRNFEQRWTKNWGFYNKETMLWEKVTFSSEWLVIVAKSFHVLFLKIFCSLQINSLHYMYLINF